jgi:peptidoglycan hydrolase-like protein with peptidoglycan-binding domain
VAELETNLAAMGFAHGLVGRPDAHFDWVTKAAVERWQHAIDLARTGTVQLGRVVFVAGSQGQGRGREGQGKRRCRVSGRGSRVALAVRAGCERLVSAGEQCRGHELRV